MNNMQDQEREYGSVYQYSPPAVMPGIRDLSVKPWETVHTQDLNKLFTSYPASEKIPSIHDKFRPMPPFSPPQRFTNYTGLDCPYKGPRSAVEGFNTGYGPSADTFFKIALFLFVLAIAYHILVGNRVEQEQAALIGGWVSY
jgi:hypothetical protein